MTRRWFLEDAWFVRYMLREATSLFVLGYVLVLVRGLVALRRGPDAFAAFVDGLASPLSIAFHAAALVAVLYHAVTFLGMAPQTVVLEVGGRRVPDARIVRIEYAVLAAVSLVIVAAFAWGP